MVIYGQVNTFSPRGYHDHMWIYNPLERKIHVNRMKTLFIHDIKFFKPLPEN
jgi:hypothetical protein